ncbi:efflux RND transporter periplasmic adaptor subunit [Flavobacterium sp. NG2]|uniref:efflux RND transporter periplasmic adaptor subunit n=1 Tax=Flavobacterium sp. NG2 TaxID=3097547 RepID=UPI002A7F6D52|nr:efflux RND transporter periplasmic adaptor subunit [Flavobacterium sp. NG2]WPR72757.1 efflux RND transporter periplasmic adaptor subunit [Flavobacterium sp. NG2]
MNKKLKYSLLFLGFLLVGISLFMVNKKISFSKAETVYTCPMPQDSVFSDKPGDCPKCGMKLIPVGKEPKEETTASAAIYTCSMHPEIEQHEPGNCPICGMTLVQKITVAKKSENHSIDYLLQNTNEFVVGDYPVIHPKDTAISTQIKLPGIVIYDSNATVSIAARIGGRIEKMYVNYKFQKVVKGQKLFDIYSPELATAQQNFIYVLTNDAQNHSIIKASRQKLALYGMTLSQINALAVAKKVNPVVTIFSPENGLVQAAEEMTENSSAGMNASATTTSPLPIKEGDYIQKNEQVFKLVNTTKVWGVFNVGQGQSSLVKVNQPIRIKTELDDTEMVAKVNFVETQLNPSERTNRIRVYLKNENGRLPVGLRLEGRIETHSIKGIWLPKQALVSVGTKKVAFVKTTKGFQAHSLYTGVEVGGFIQIIDGISTQDEVIQNAQYLMDSEAFIKTTQRE